MKMKASIRCPELRSGTFCNHTGCTTRSVFMLRLRPSTRCCSLCKQNNSKFYPQYRSPTRTCHPAFPVLSGVPLPNPSATKVACFLPPIHTTHTVQTVPSGRLQFFPWLMARISPLVQVSLNLHQAPLNLLQCFLSPLAIVSTLAFTQNRHSPHLHRCSEKTFGRI